MPASDRFLQPLSSVPKSELRAVEYILCDVDDTLTTNGKLPADVYASLWQLRDAGYKVIPITGRPAGWCDMMIRQWPIRAVVGENGACVFELAQGTVRTILHPEVNENTSVRLAGLRDHVLSAIPGIRLAKDQPYRLFDVAFDFAEDEPVLPYESAVRVRDLCLASGAQARISSIHVNTWYGDYSKADMSWLFLTEQEGLRPSDVAGSVVFIGDSPNDAPMFAAFPLSIGVANYGKMSHLSEHHPRYITSREGGDGFVEFAQTLTSPPR